MKQYTRLQITSQLAPLPSSIYSQAIRNINKKRSEQSLLTRKQIKTLVYQGYTPDSISNALNQLHDIGLMFFDKVSRSWLLVLKMLRCIDIYGAYMDYVKNVKRKAINENIYLFGYYDSERILGGSS